MSATVLRPPAAERRADRHRQTLPMPPPSGVHAVARSRAAADSDCPSSCWRRSRRAPTARRPGSTRRAHRSAVRVRPERRAQRVVSLRARVRDVGGGTPDRRAVAAETFGETGQRRCGVAGDEAPHGIRASRQSSDRRRSGRAAAADARSSAASRCRADASRRPASRRRSRTALRRGPADVYDPSDAGSILGQNAAPADAADDAPTPSSASARTGVRRAARAAAEPQQRTSAPRKIVASASSERMVERRGGRRQRQQLVERRQRHRRALDVDRDLDADRPRRRGQRDAATASRSVPSSVSADHTRYARFAVARSIASWSLRFVDVAAFAVEVRNVDLTGEVQAAACRR